MNPIQQQHKEWQTHWRSILGKPATDTPAHLDEDLSDYIFLPEEKLLTCFSPIPNGTTIAHRVLKAHAGVTESFHSLSDDALIALLRQTITELSQVLETDPKEIGTPQVYRLDFANRRKMNRGAERLSDCFEEDLLDLIKCKLGPRGEAAYTFLSEPLYNIRQDYTPANWAMWGLLSDQYDIDPYKTMFKLWYSNIHFMMNHDGFYVIADESKD